MCLACLILTACVTESGGRPAFIEVWKQSCGEGGYHPQPLHFSLVATLIYQREARGHSWPRWQQPAAEAAPTTILPPDLHRRGSNASHLASKFRGTHSRLFQGLLPRAVLQSPSRHPAMGRGSTSPLGKHPTWLSASPQHPYLAWGRGKSLLPLLWAWTLQSCWAKQGTPLPMGLHLPVSLTTANCHSLKNQANISFILMQQILSTIQALLPLASRPHFVPTYHSGTVKCLLLVVFPQECESLRAETLCTVPHTQEPLLKWLLSTICG